MREVSHGISSLRKKSKIILLPPNFISWRRTEFCWTFFHYHRLKSWVRWEVSHGGSYVQSKWKIILLPRTLSNDD